MYSSTNNSSSISDGNVTPPPSRASMQTHLEANSKGDKPSFSSHVDTRERKGMLPLLFERASNRIWDPSFDSKVLESEFTRFVVVVDRHRFKSAAIYVATVSLILTIYFGATRGVSAAGKELMIGTGISTLVALFFFLLTTCTNLYRKPREAILISLIFVIMLVSAEIVSFYRIKESDLTYASRFTIATSTILLIYTLIPALPMYMCLLIAVAFSVAHELSAGFKAIRTQTAVDIVSRGCLHLGVHLMGLAMFFMAQVKKRSTFWRVGQSIVAKRDLEIEQRMKDRMIRWVMPKVVADWLIKDGLQRIKIRGVSEPKVPFRPFNMDRVENVSILFADIVGFTKMSSNKSAETLVNLLNDLFGRFDELTEINNCEKVSTLGDCYYCVAGCPEKTRYHAICCVEMGLDIVLQIKKFRQETKEDVDMRVGIHTGSVLCGIVGNRRRRFDVWSNDVTIANRMEATGKPGRVHISESSLKFLEDQYVVEDGEGLKLNKDEEKLKTYLIDYRKNGLSGNKPWQREKAHRDSDSSLRQAIKSGMTPKDEQGQKHKHGSQSCVSPKNDKTHPNEVAFYIDDGEDMHAYQQQMLRQKSYSVAEDDSIELNFLGKGQTGAQSPPSPPKPHSRIAFNLAKTHLPFQRLNAQLNFTLNDAFMRDALRDLNDQQLVKLMRKKQTQKEYFTNPPLTKVKMNFNVEGLETKYRKECFKDFKLHPKVTTFASPKIHFFFDVVTATLLFLINVVVCYLVFRPPPATLIVLTPIVCLIMLLLLLFRCFRVSAMTACCPDRKCTEPFSDMDKENSTSSQTSHSELNQPRHSIGRISIDGTLSLDINKRRRTLKEVMSDIATSLWVQSHLFGAFMMCLPLVVTFATLHNCDGNHWKKEEFEIFSNLMTVGLLYFCSFTQLSYIMKSTLALIVSIVFCLLLRFEAKSYCTLQKKETDRTSANDIIVAIVIQLILVILLNRLHEEGVRVNYYGDREAAEKKNNASDQKRVADSLLVDMFPRHVSEQLRFKSHCSRNYDNVGVLFATIVNFGEFYEENFAGGIECIRILHELVADFDKELDKFDDLEKLKTVHGTTFMAASGLCVPDNNNTDKHEPSHPNLHLKNLIDFTLAIFSVLNEFNKNMLGFRFLLRCGFNAGPVTAGVIGSTKPQYDIWGDAVNLASRMDSTGVSGRIQMPEKSMEMLTDFFTFEERGFVYVKGKNDMKTYLLCDRTERTSSTKLTTDVPVS